MNRRMDVNGAFLSHKKAVEVIAFNVSSNQKENVE